jgi:hypothetical protein
MGLPRASFGMDTSQQAQKSTVGAIATIMRAGSKNKKEGQQQQATPKTPKTAPVGGIGEEKK